ncbi:hypothetical protein HW555_008044 [Spodoptera exigua]|uniref:Uncharacterized protein n=1 Tax=Spodoptera exigua TaxID=7107 RepID=A0A835GEU7_SPOEX|nr:hypothetical protein HW555_008044 [Spodoptera exigua]
MPKSATEDYTRSSDKQRSLSRSTTGLQVPLHFAIHRPGCHFESCCGICNLFPGVLLIAFCQVLVGSILLTLILTHGPQYDEMHMTPTTQFISLATGIVLSGITGAGILLIVVALTENCRAMLVYLLVATIVWLGLVSLAITKIGRACIRFKDVLYFFSIVVVFSFYHFRYVRRAILLHENECE